MNFHSELLDLFLVPSGLLIMFAYHLYLLYKYLKYPYTTVMGLENHDKSAWVARLAQVEKKDALTVISSNLTAATFFASVSLTLSSLIGVWIANASAEVFESDIILGDRRDVTLSIKYICLLASFLLGFSCFVQAARYYVHANYLVCMPNNEIPYKNVERAIRRGGLFWTVGLRALFVALNLLLWFFGPIPMFASSVITVVVLCLQDINKTEPYDYGPTPTPTPVQSLAREQTLGQAQP